MSKPYTEDDFSGQITEDRRRIREISDLKASIRAGDDNLRRVLLRALVAICYAHWEGYVRFSAKKYLEHVALRRLKYGELETVFPKLLLAALGIPLHVESQHCRALRSRR
jgi:hypothetical protein